MYTHMYVYKYIYIYIERERYRDRDRDIGEPITEPQRLGLDRPRLEEEDARETNPPIQPEGSLWGFDYKFTNYMSER